MAVRLLPEITLEPQLKRVIDASARRFQSTEQAEAFALVQDAAQPFCAGERWALFCEFVRDTIHSHGYVVVRGLEPDEGRSLLVLASALKQPFDTYGGGRIVKRFRMSPWTTELSHTIQAGDFHTDGNVSTTPPISTAIQCEREDPGAPDYAEQRVAHLPDLLDRLASGDADDLNAFRFLSEPEVALAHERSAETWRGRLVKDGTIRYHPQSVRIASRRFAYDPVETEAIIATIHRAAIEVSIPFHTSPGDTVLVSNRTALHYRGECTVRFIHFPLEFESRSLFVLHLRDPHA